MNLDLLVLDKPIVDYIHSLKITRRAPVVNDLNVATKITFPIRNKELLYSLFANQYLYKSLNLGIKTLNFDNDLLEAIINNHKDLELDLITMKVRFINTYSGIYTVIYTNKHIDFSTDQRTQLIVDFFDILSYIFVDTKPVHLKYYRNLRRFFMIYKSTYSYLILLSLQDIINNYGLCNELLFYSMILKKFKKFKNLLNKAENAKIFALLHKIKQLKKQRKKTTKK